MDPSADLGSNDAIPVVESDMKNTKWTQEIDIAPPELPDAFWENAGVTPVLGVVDDEIGEEVILLINDPTEDAEKLGELDPFVLNVSSGSVDTDHGALGFVLFSVPDPEDAEEPFAVWEILFDATNDDMAGPFHSLADQSHWHAILLGPGPQVLNVFEFDNTYFLKTGLKEIAQATDAKPCTDFDAAVADAHARYPLQTLFETADQSGRPSAE